MRRVYTILFSLFIGAVPGLAVNFPGIPTCMLDAGERNFTLINTGASGGSQLITIPPGFTRTGVVISNIYVPPTSATTYTSCPSPASISINRERGRPYIWYVYADSGGTPIVPFKTSKAAPSWKTGTCNAPGTLPQIVPAIITTNPLPLPYPVINQDCFQKPFRLFFDGGVPHSTTGLRLWVVLHAFAHNNTTKWDNKLSFKLNNSIWLDFKNTNSSLVRDDAMSAYSRPNTATGIDYTLKNKIGGYVQIATFQMDIPNGTIGASDPHVDIYPRFNGTDGQGSGFRIVYINIIEADKVITSLTTTSNSTVASIASNGWTSGNTIVVRNAPGMYMRYSGMRTLTAAAANTVTFPPCGTGNPACTSPNQTVGPRIDRGVTGNNIIVSDIIYAARALIAKSSFTTAEPSRAAPVGGVAATGECWFKFGNATCTPNQRSQFASPNSPDIHNVMFYGTCGGGATGCHTSSGRDIAYMNFEDEVIIARSEFHATADQTAIDILAYIRSLPDPIYPNARPWNPPLQPGPGMSAGVFRKSASTLTNIQISSSGTVGLATLPTGHGIIVGEPFIISGATVDTDLKGRVVATAVAATTVSFTSPASVSDATYTESTLQIVAPDKVMAGTGWDAVLQDCYESLAEYMHVDKSKWTINSYFDSQDIPYCMPFPDYKNWVPPIHPADAFRGSNFLASAFNTYHQARLAGGASAITPGSAASYAAGGYAADDSAASQLYAWNTVGPSLGITGGKHLDDSLAGNRAPSTHPLMWNSIPNKGLMDTWELIHEYNLMGLDGQKNQAQQGAATATDCWKPIEFPSSILFSNGAHRYTKSNLGIFDGSRLTYDYESNIWYVLGAIFGSGNCRDTPSAPLSNDYYNAYLKSTQLARPTGYASILLPAIIIPQAGRQYADFAYYPTQNDQNGQDWTAIFSQTINYYNRFSYFTFTEAEWTTLQNDILDIWIAAIGSKDISYWNTMITASAEVPLPATAWAQGVGGPGSMIAKMLPMFEVWGATSSKIDTVQTFAEDITQWNGYDFAAARASGLQGNIDRGATIPNMTTPGSHTITFTSCPESVAHIQSNSYMPLVISGGAGANEILRPTGGTCAVAGGAGTLIITTVNAHDNGGTTVKWGCYPGALTMNWREGGDGSPTWFKCSIHY